MKQMSLLMAVIVAGIFSMSVAANGMDRKAEKNVKKGVVKAWRLGNTNYCHLKFPPIKIRSLSTKTPELADPEYVGLIDYYGPCDHDPLGEVEIERQQDNLDRRLYDSR